jgi:hypothetical protein
MPHANLSSRFPKGPSPDGGTFFIVRSKLIYWKSALFFGRQQAKLPPSKSKL